MHAVAELHDTPDNWLAVAPAGLGVVRRVHAVPSHASANVWVPDPSEESPTAVQAVAAQLTGPR